MFNSKANLTLMKKFLILLIAPLLMATQCDDDNDPLVSTEYYIQNDSSIDLTYLTDDATEVLIESNTTQFIAINTDNTSSIAPSENITFNNVTLYKPDTSGNLVIAYQQEPINDSLWELNEISDFDYIYTVIITDDLVD